MLAFFAIFPSLQPAVPLPLLLELELCCHLNTGPAPQPAWSGTQEAAGMTWFPKVTCRGSEGLYKDGTRLTDVAKRFHAISSWEHMRLNRKNAD